MSLFARGSINSILNHLKGNKISNLPKSSVAQIEKQLMYSSNSIRPYDILSIYNYLCFSRDEKTFHKLDSIIFPPRGKQPMVELSFPLAYKRLFCLIKYQMPYSHFIENVRELMHEVTPNSTDMRFLLTFGYFNQVRLDEKMIRFYEEILMYLDEIIDETDPLTLVAIRKAIEKDRFNLPVVLESKNKIDDKINFYVPNFTEAQMKFLVTTFTLSKSWLFSYCFKCRESSWRTYGLFLDFLMRDFAWKQWAMKKYGRKGVLQRLPKAQQSKNPFIIIEKIFSRFNMNIPYIDQFFNFHEIQENGTKKIRLKNPEKQYRFFLQNSYHSVISGLDIESLDKLHEIESVLQDHKFLRKNYNSIFMYLSVQNTIIYTCYSNDQKYDKQRKLLKETAMWVKQVKNKFIVESSKILIMRLFKQIATFDFRTYRTEEFHYVYQKIQQISREFYSKIIISRIPKELNQIEKLISFYVSGEKPKTNNFLFGEMKALVSPHEGYEIFIAKNVEVNRSIVCDYLLKIRSKETSQEVKILLDLSMIKNTFSAGKENLIPIRYFWKHQYLREWCGLRYFSSEESSIQDFLESQQFIQFVSQSK